MELRYTTTPYGFWSSWKHDLKKRLKKWYWEHFKPYKLDWRVNMIDYEPWLSRQNSRFAQTPQTTFGVHVEVHRKLSSAWRTLWHLRCRCGLSCMARGIYEFLFFLADCVQRWLELVDPLNKEIRQDGKASMPSFLSTWSSKSSGV